jgi:hypothetical protein
MIVVGGLLVISLCVTPYASAQDPAPTACTDCHNEQRDRKHPGPPQKLLADSVHKTLDCTDCYQALSMEKLDRAARRSHGLAFESWNGSVMRTSTLDLAESFDITRFAAALPNRDNGTGWSCLARGRRPSQCWPLTDNELFRASVFAKRPSRHADCSTER